MFLSVNSEGFFSVTQRVIKQMLAQETGGSIVNITAAQGNHPIARKRVESKSRAPLGAFSVPKKIVAENIRLNPAISR